VSKQGLGKQSISRRRSMLKYGISIGLLPVTGGAFANDSVASIPVTPPQTKGPFYPVHQQLDKDADLTWMKGSTGKAEGTYVNVMGQVLDEQGKPLPGTLVEIWQADTHGRYRHSRDPNPAKPDPNFQGWGISQTDGQGIYRFLTVLPGAYPAGPGWMRPPHIHFKIAREGYNTLITQMYFPDQKYNDADLILQDLSLSVQQRVISRQVESTEGIPGYRFDIVLGIKR